MYTRRTSYLTCHERKGQQLWKADEVCLFALVNKCTYVTKPVVHYFDHNTSNGNDRHLCDSRTFNSKQYLHHMEVLEGPRENRLRVSINIGRNCKSMVEMPSAQQITMVPKKIDKFKTKVHLLSKTLVLDFSGFFWLPSRLQQTRGLGYTRK